MITSKLHSITHYKAIAQKSRGIQQSIINIFGSSAASAFSALALMLLSRFLGPAYFGQFSSAYALTLILARLNDLGLSVATSKLVPVASEDKQQALLSLIFRFRIALSGLIIVLGVIVSQFLPRFLLSDNSALILLAFLVCAATALFEHAQFALQALHRFKLAAILNASQGFLKLLFVVPFIFIIVQQAIPLKKVVLLIFTFYMISPGLPVILAKTIKSNLLPLSLHLPDTVNLNKIRLDIWKIAKHAGFGIVAAGIIENVDILFVQAYLSDYEAGLLGGVSRVALLLYVLAYALGNVLNPRVAKYKDWINLHKFWNKAWFIAALCVVGFILSMFVAPYLITYTIGQAYLPGLGLMRILLAAGFVTVAAIPFIALFYSYNLPWYFSVSGIVQLVIVLAGNGLLIPIFGVNAAVWTRLAARVVLLIMTITIARWQLIKITPTLEIEETN
jgi:O-antigen/teichoic acid export membrane protein